VQINQDLPGAFQECTPADSFRQQRNELRRRPDLAAAGRAGPGGFQAASHQQKHRGRGLDRNNHLDTPQAVPERSGRAKNH
jgi:hypothetical protein